MLCRAPFLRGIVPYGCGQCLPCRINRRRQWTWRQVFESLLHEENCFVTLTYGPDYLPSGGSLEPRDLQLFIKRLRFLLGSRKVRYVAVGEYGENTYRPHYHLSLFGMSGYSVLDGVKAPTSGQLAIERCWKLGFVGVGDFNEKTAQYVSSYVVKKLKDRTDPQMAGLYPEFGRMSRRPGIGHGAMSIIAKSLCDSGHGMALIEETGDVPRELQIGKRKIPLGRYLLSKLREAIGFTPEWIEEIKAKGTYESSVEMLALLDRAFALEEVPTPKSAYLLEKNQMILNVEGRAKVWRKKHQL